MDVDKKPRFTWRPERRQTGRRFLGFSTLTRMIFLSNLFGLIILIIGALTLNQFSRGLIDAKVDNLQSQTLLIANLLGEKATGFEGVSTLDEVQARRIMRQVDVPQKARIRLYDKSGRLVADSDLLDDHVDVGTLEPIRDPGLAAPQTNKWWEQLQAWADHAVNQLPVFREHREQLQRNLTRDIKTALMGDVVAGEQYEGDRLVVAVAMPVRRVQNIQGAIVFETYDVDTILASQRRGLTPIILIAIVAAFFSSVALTLFVALPIRQLARAAEQVSRTSEKRDAIPDLSARGDEIGDLSIVLRNMTMGLYERVDDIANFAADVAHEIKNPLTSLRSASDTLGIAKTDEQRGKMIKIIKNDVARMDRLITDISKASRMDAALAREPAEPVDMDKFLEDIAGFYTQTRRETGVDVIHMASGASEPIIVRVLENSLGQVLRNLIDNALTFSPQPVSDDGPISSVRVQAHRVNDADKDYVLVTIDDDGPGISAENLEDVFNRFYTYRPENASFGDHSGLGLAICRQIMDAHNGTITASNRMDDGGKISGARFTLRFPVRRVSEDGKKKKRKNPRNPKKTKTSRQKNRP